MECTRRVRRLLAVGALALPAACGGHSAESVVAGPRPPQARSFRFVFGDVELRGDLTLRGQRPLVEVELSVSDLERDRRTTYAFEDDLSDLGSGPCELWVGDRFLYAIELRGVGSWLELMQREGKIEDHLLVTKVMGAAEE